MNSGESCGFMCQHPSCWSAERERIRQAFYTKTGAVIDANHIPGSCNQRITNQAEFKWSTYTVINLSDLIGKQEYAPLDIARATSDSSLWSYQSSENATHITKSFREELFGSSTRSLSSAASSQGDTSPPLAQLKREPKSGKDSHLSRSIYKEEKGNFQFPVLSVNLSGGAASDLSGQYPHLIWIPGKRKVKKKLAETEDKSKESGQLSLKYIDGDLLSLDSWITYKNGITRRRLSQYSGSTHRAIMRHAPRRLPPLDAHSTPRHSLSRRSTRSAVERILDEEEYTPLTVSQPLQSKESDRKEIKGPGTPNNTRNTERGSNETGKMLTNGLQTKLWKQEASPNKDTMFLDNGLLMVPVREEATEVVYEGRRVRKTTRETLTLPRISVPKECLKQMPVLNHHCRNSVPRYWIPEVQFEPLKGTGATPSVASTDSLIRRISVDLPDDIGDRNGLRLEADASSLKAYKKLLQDFPDFTPESESASISSDAMEWRFNGGANTPMPTPATPVEQRATREQPGGITSGAGSKSEHTLNRPSKPLRDNEEDLGTEQVLSDGALVVAKLQDHDSSTDTQVLNIEHEHQKEGIILHTSQQAKEDPLLLGQEDDTGNNNALTLEDPSEEDLQYATESQESLMNSMEMKQETPIEHISSKLQREQVPTRGDSLQEMSQLAEEQLKPQLITSLNDHPVRASVSYTYGTPLIHQETDQEEGIDKSKSLPLFQIPAGDDLFSGRRQWHFIPTSRKQPPLLMSTPGRAPPQPGRQPSSTSVPSELKVRSLDLFHRVNKSTVDLSTTLLIEKLSLNEPRRGSVQYNISPEHSSIVGSTVSTPIVVPTMENAAHGESSENLTLSPEKSKSLFSRSSEPYSTTDGRTSSIGTEARNTEEKDTEVKDSVGMQEDDVSIASVNDGSVEREEIALSPNFSYSDEQQSLLSVSPSYSRTESRANESSMLHAALSSFINQGNPQRDDSRMSSRQSNVSDSGPAPKEAPPSSPILNIPDFTAGIDLNLNLEEELLKAVQGLEGFSFDDLDIGSVRSLELQSLASD